MRKLFSWVDTKKIIKICSLTPPIVRESEWGPALQQEQQEFESNKVRVSLLVDVNDNTARPWGIIPTRIFARRTDDSEGVPQEQAPLSACYNDSTAVELARRLLSTSLTKTWLRERSLRGYTLGSRVARARESARQQVPGRSASFSCCRRREQEPSTT